MKDEITFKVTCPHCQQKMKVTRETATDYMDDWDRLLSDFDTEEFCCSCGKSFFGAETKESDAYRKILDLAKDLKAQGKFDISKDGLKLKLGFSDIWKLIREVHKLKDLVGD